MCLNFLFLLTSLPLATAGASTCALYEVLYGISRGKEGGCVRKYIQAFKKYFWRGTLYWLICLAAALFLVLGVWGARLMEGGCRVFFLAVAVVLGFLWTGILSFGLILTAWTDFSAGQVFRCAFLITGGSFPWLILNMLITCLPVFLIAAGGRFVLAYGMPLFVLFGVPFLGYVKTFVYRQALKKYRLCEDPEEG